MRDEGRLVYGYQPPAARPLHTMMQGSVAAVQQHDIPRSQLHAVAELLWICIRRKQGNGSLCGHGEPSNTRLDFRDVG